MAQIIILLVAFTICSTALANIIRPCDLSNYKCLGRNFAANSGCNRHVQGFIPEEYRVKLFRFEAAYFNSSYIDSNLIVKNHHKCFVSEYFVNTKTNRAVLSIDCPNLDLESDRVLIQHRGKQEDTFYHYHIHAEYPMVRITLNLHNRNEMNICNAHVFTEVLAPPRFHVNPKDKPTKSFLSRDLSELNIFERESFYYGGDRLAKVFMESLICDFKCNKLILPHYTNDIVDGNDT